MTDPWLAPITRITPTTRQGDTSPPVIPEAERAAIMASPTFLVLQAMVDTQRDAAAHWETCDFCKRGRVCLDGQALMAANVEAMRLGTEQADRNARR